MPIPVILSDTFHRNRLLNRIYTFSTGSYSFLAVKLYLYIIHICIHVQIVVAYLALALQLYIIHIFLESDDINAKLYVALDIVILLAYLMILQRKKNKFTVAGNRNYKPAPDSIHF